MNALDNLTPHAHWLLRIALASVFLYHGLDKFPELAMMAEMMEMPVLMLGLVATMETLAGLFILVGGLGYDWMTRLAGLLIVPVMLGAIAMVHWGQWHFMATETHPMGGMQFQVTLLLIALYFVIVGNNRAAPASANTSARRGEDVLRGQSTRM